MGTARLFFSILAATAATPVAAEISAWIEHQATGNYIVTVQNRGNDPIVLRSAVVNRKDGDPICHLRPFEYPDGEVALQRSDSASDEYGIHPTDAARLAFGDEADLLVYRGCGRFLEMKLLTDDGTIAFSSGR